MLPDAEVEDEAQLDHFSRAVHPSCRRYSRDGFTSRWECEDTDHPAFLALGTALDQDAAFCSGGTDRKGAMNLSFPDEASAAIELLSAAPVHDLGDSKSGAVAGHQRGAVA